MFIVIKIFSCIDCILYKIKICINKKIKLMKKINNNKINQIKHNLKNDDNKKNRWTHKNFY